MSSLPSTLESIDATIEKVQNQLTKVDIDCDFHDQLVQKLYDLTQRRKQLSTYNEEMVKRIDAIKAEIDKKHEELEDEKSERIANIIFEYEAEITKLPAIADVELIAEEKVEPEKPAPPPEIINRTVPTVKKYAKRYYDEYKHISDQDNFFHASASSCGGKYVFTPSNDDIDNWTNDLLSGVILPTTQQYPLLLTDVDRIIHSNDVLCDNLFVIFDASLRVILTNISKEIPSEFDCRMVIHDSVSQKFSPVSELTKNWNYFCIKCFLFEPEKHKCRRQCPICLSKGEPFRCFKPSPESRAKICDKCSAFCFTYDCYEAHRKICPLPVQRTHDEVLQLIKSTF